MAEASVYSSTSSTGGADAPAPCGQSHIRAAVAERDDLVIERRRPQVGVVRKRRRDVVAIVREAIGTRRSADTGGFSPDK
jgi:hypothetical protein